MEELSESNYIDDKSYQVYKNVQDGKISYKFRPNSQYINRNNLHNIVKPTHNLFDSLSIVTKETHKKVSSDKLFSDARLSV